MAVRAGDFQKLSLWLPAPRRHSDFQIAAQVTSRDRIGVGQQLLARPGEDQLAAVLSRAGPQVEDMVGSQNCLGIVLHDYQRVAEIAQALQNSNQPVGIARVQADRRLVEHIQRAHEMRAERRGELDALRFAAR